LKVAGFAVRLRWEWLRRSRPDLSWCGLPRKPEREVQAMFQTSVTVAIHDGLSSKFWTDSWLSDGPICRFTLHLFNAISKRRRQKSVREAITTEAGFATSRGARPHVLCDYVLVWVKVERGARRPDMRRIHLALDRGRLILRLLGLQGLLLWHGLLAWRNGAMEG
jgi:hypothetical protein